MLLLRLADAALPLRHAAFFQPLRAFAADTPPYATLKAMLIFPIFADASCHDMLRHYAAAVLPCCHDAMLMMLLCASC